jgi:hypothetical protein
MGYMAWGEKGFMERARGRMRRWKETKPSVDPERSVRRHAAQRNGREVVPRLEMPGREFTGDEDGMKSCCCAPHFQLHQAIIPCGGALHSIAYLILIRSSHAPATRHR